MKAWIIVALIIGILVVAGIVISVQGVAADAPENVDCKSCGNSCTGESNCGLASCGAVQGRSCGCGK